MKQLQRRVSAILVAISKRLQNLAYVWLKLGFWWSDIGLDCRWLGGCILVMKIDLLIIPIILVAVLKPEGSYGCVYRV